MPTKRRIIGYARESTRDQAINGFNLDDQEKKIIQYTEIFYEKNTYNLTIVREEGASAKSLDRPRMNDIVKMVKARQVDIIIIHNLDRLTRQVRDLATLLELFDQYDVSLVSITEKIDTKTPMGRFFIFLIVLIAQWEWETISNRSKRGIEESTRQGNYTLAHYPIGYRRNPENNHKLIVEEEEAKVVKQIFEAIAYNDYNVEALSRKMTQDLILGRHWSKHTINKVVHNKIYYGTLERFGVEYPDNTIPIIDKSLFDQVQQRLSVKRTHIRKREYIYKGFIYCSECNGLMIANSSQSKNGKIHLYYRCYDCRVQVSEREINNKYNDAFTEKLREDCTLNEYEQMKVQYAELSEILEAIPVSVLNYKMNVDNLTSMYACREEDKDKLHRCLKMIMTNVASIEFADLPFREKRIFLQKHVDSIVFDSKSDDLEIKYLPI